MNIQIEDVAAVGTLVRRHPTLIALFEELEIDYACKGGRTLRDAAAYAGHDPKQVLELVRMTAGEAEDDRGTLAELIHNIITDHHKFASEQSHDKGTFEYPRTGRNRTRYRRRRCAQVS